MKSRLGKVGVAMCGLALGHSAKALAANLPTTTVYVGQHFEVRDHEQPTKYVFNGATRVASVTGSLTTSSRIQRLRLYPGWNLVSLAVATADLTGLLQQNGVLADSVYRWNSAAQDYSAIAAGQNVPGGTVLWVHCMTSALVGLVGDYAAPLPSQLQPGGTYVPGAGLEAWSPDLPAGVDAWSFDARASKWDALLSGDLSLQSDPPPAVTPGQAIYFRGGVVGTLEMPDPKLRLRYYHQDHLGSSSEITDADGALVEESAFHPFGHPRNYYGRRQIHEPYRFTQKERDRESGLHYFGARFYAATIGRWATCDPAGTDAGLNPYRYVENNPIRLVDPHGTDGTAPETLRTVATAIGCNPGEGYNWWSLAASTGLGGALDTACTATPRFASRRDRVLNRIEEISAGIGDGLSGIVDTQEWRRQRGIKINDNSGYYVGGRLGGCAVNEYAGSQVGARRNASGAPGEPAIVPKNAVTGGAASESFVSMAPRNAPAVQRNVVRSDRSAIGFADTVSYREVLEEPAYLEQLAAKNEARYQMIGQRRAEMDAMINAGQSARSIIQDIENSLDTMFPVRPR